MELTIRTPYKTVVDKLTEFSRLSSRTNESHLNIENNVPASMHMLPPGMISVNTNKTDDKFSG